MPDDMSTARSTRPLAEVIRDILYRRVAIALTGNDGVYDGPATLDIEFAARPITQAVSRGEHITGNVYVGGLHETPLLAFTVAISMLTGERTLDHIERDRVQTAQMIAETEIAQLNRKLDRQAQDFAEGVSQTRVPADPVTFRVEYHALPGTPGFFAVAMEPATRALLNLPFWADSVVEIGNAAVQTIGAATARVPGEILLDAHRIWDHPGWLTADLVAEFKADNPEIAAVLNEKRPEKVPAAIASVPVRDEVHGNDLYWWIVRLPLSSEYLVGAVYHPEGVGVMATQAVHAHTGADLADIQFSGGRGVHVAPEGWLIRLHERIDRLDELAVMRWTRVSEDDLRETDSRVTIHPLTESGDMVDLSPARRDETGKPAAQIDTEAELPEGVAYPPLKFHPVRVWTDPETGWTWWRAADRSDRRVCAVGIHEDGDALAALRVARTALSVMRVTDPHSTSTRRHTDRPGWAVRADASRPPIDKPGTWYRIDGVGYWPTVGEEMSEPVAGETSEPLPGVTFGPVATIGPEITVYVIEMTDRSIIWRVEHPYPDTVLPPAADAGNTVPWFVGRSSDTGRARSAALDACRGAAVHAGEGNSVSFEVRTLDDTYALAEVNGVEVPGWWPAAFGPTLPTLGGVRTIRLSE